jgi:hypothetical protein
LALALAQVWNDNGLFIGQVIQIGLDLVVLTPSFLQLVLIFTPDAVKLIEQVRCSCLELLSEEVFVYRVKIGRIGHGVDGQLVVLHGWVLGGVMEVAEMGKVLLA